MSFISFTLLNKNMQTHTLFRDIIIIDYNKIIIFKILQISLVVLSFHELYEV